VSILVRDGRLDDFKFVNELERSAIGDEANWGLDRVLSWLNAGMFKSVIIYEDNEFLSYASAFSITRDSFIRICTGELLPENLELSDGSTERGFHWFGLLITNPARYLEGWGSFAYNELLKQIGDRIVADAYSFEGESFLIRKGWVKVGDYGKPTYVNSSFPYTEIIA
jgi:hypothetical protein